MTVKQLSVRGIFVALLALSTIPGFSRNSQAEDRVFILVNTLYQDTIEGDSHDFERFLIHRMKDQFAGSRFVTIRENRRELIHDALEKVVAGGAVVSGMMVYSHGDSQINPKYYMSILDFGASIVDVSDEVDMRKVFGPLVGHYAPGARIILSGCATVEAGTIPDKARNMRNVLANFGISDGSLYMNETNANDFRDVYMKQLYSNSKTSEARRMHLFAQLAAVVTYPIMFAMEDFIYNRGFTLECEPRTEVPCRLYHDDFFNAQETRIPSGRALSAY